MGKHLSPQENQANLINLQDAYVNPVQTIINLKNSKSYKFLIVLNVDNIYTDIKGELPKSCIRELQKKLSFRKQGFQFMGAYNTWIKDKNSQKIRRAWDGYIKQFWVNKKRTYFPTGLYSEVVKYFMFKNIPFTTIDNRIRPEHNFLLQHNTDYVLREYQSRARDRACEMSRGILQAATGSGKTLIGASIIEQLKVTPFIFFVTSIDLLNQAKESLEDYLRYKGSPLTVGQIGGGLINIADVNVMTVQTAIRALGKKWDKNTKFDSDDTDDLTPIQERKAEIQELIHEARGAFCDEVQHWKSDTCQLISKELKSCYFKYGASATPYRDEGDDLIVQACFGKKICEITASQLIRDGHLVRPNINIVNIENTKSPFKTWQKIYKHRIIEDPYYNNLVANLANGYINKGDLTLVLVQQINHGKLLQEMIDGSVFLSGKSAKKKREDNIRFLKRGDIRCIISTSLPKTELLMVRKDGIVKQMEIGELCHNYAQEVSMGQFETLCSVDGLTYVWRKITQTHIHKLENNIVRVETDQGEDVYVTENHSLMTPDLQQVKPEVGKPACVPQGIPAGQPIKNINLVELLSTTEDESLEVEIVGLSQSRTKQLKSEYDYFYNYAYHKGDVILESLKNKTTRYKLAIRELFKNFSYKNHKYRAKLSAVARCSSLLEEFECRIYMQRNENKCSLPTSLKITPELGLVSGLICAEKYDSYNSENASYAFDLISQINNPEAKEIKLIYEKVLTQIFGHSHCNETSQLIQLKYKMLSYLFSALGHRNSNGEKRVPDYIYNSVATIQKQFLWGLHLGSDTIDNDNEHKNYNKVCIQNSSRPLVVGTFVLLQMMKKDYDCYSYSTNQQRHYVVNIKHSTLNNTNKNADYPSSHRLQQKIEVVDSSNVDTVYDISVEESHNFLGGMLLCHNTIFDEGIDIRPLSSLVLAGQGKSKNRAMQRIGRITRTYEGKTSATATDLRVHDKFLLDHSKEREKIYRTEPEYKINHFHPSMIEL